MADESMTAESREAESREADATNKPESVIERGGDVDARIVVVTGASTGIGFAVAQELIEHGYEVIGTVRKQEDAHRLTTTLGRRMHAVLMDVADDEEVKRATDEIAAIVGERGITALINNAGIVVAGPLMHVDLEELRYQFDVNVVGVVAMTQAMLPLLGGDRQSAIRPGRVVNISSVSAHVTYPFLAPYAASKHALESISDGMRRELALYGIDVIVMVLGAVQTPIWGKASGDDLTRYAQTDYAGAVAQMQATTGRLSTDGMPVERVAVAMRRAIEEPKVRARHVLVNDYWRGWLLPKLIPTRLLDYAMTRQFGLTRSS